MIGDFVDDCDDIASGGAFVGEVEEDHENYE
jgi:hypothetical protein